MPKKQPQESAANAKLTLSRKSPQIVDQTTKLADIVKANPQYAAQPIIQAAVADWLAAAAAIAKNDQEMKANRVGIVALIAARQAAVAAWKRATKTVLAAVDTVSNGSAKAIKDWGFDVVTRVDIPSDNSAPSPPRLTYDKHMEPLIRWKAVPSHRGYNLQIGDGTPAGWGPVIQLAQAKYKPSGLTPGQHIAVRVAVQRKGGLSPYSDAMTATIR